MRQAVVINEMEESLNDSDFPKQGHTPRAAATMALRIFGGSIGAYNHRQFDVGPFPFEHYETGWWEHATIFVHFHGGGSGDFEASRGALAEPAPGRSASVPAVHPAQPLLL